MKSQVNIKRAEKLIRMSPLFDYLAPKAQRRLAVSVVRNLHTDARLTSVDDLLSTAQKTRLAQIKGSLR